MELKKHKAHKFYDKSLYTTTRKILDRHSNPQYLEYFLHNCISTQVPLQGVEFTRNNVSRTIPLLADRGTKNPGYIYSLTTDREVSPPLPAKRYPQNYEPVTEPLSKMDTPEATYLIPVFDCSRYSVLILSSLSANP